MELWKMVSVGPNENLALQLKHCVVWKTFMGILEEGQHRKKVDEVRIDVYKINLRETDLIQLSAEFFNGLLDFTWIGVVDRWFMRNFPAYRLQHKIPIEMTIRLAAKLRLEYLDQPEGEFLIFWAANYICPEIHYTVAPALYIDKFQKPALDWINMYGESQLGYDTSVALPILREER